MKKVVVIVILLAVAAGAKEWYETAAFYQIYPQTFFDAGDVEAFKGMGTLKGIQEKLDYIHELGFDAIWLTPIFQSSFNAFGYDITDYTEIDPRYGGSSDFLALINAVHDKGMKIVIDFVPNHCGEAHEFFQKSKDGDEEFENYFVWTKITNFNDADGKLKPSNWQRIGGAPGSAWNEVGEGEDKKFYYAQFSGNMPDFNLREPKVKEYLEGVMKFWLDLKVDGFRIDAISHGFEIEADDDEKFKNEDRNSDVKDDDTTNFDYLIHKHTQDQPETFDLIYGWRQFLDEYSKNHSATNLRIMMTESYSAEAVIKKFYQSEDETPKNGSHLPFNFQMIKLLNNETTAAEFVKMVTDWIKVLPKGKVTNWVIGNHDQPRAASRFGRNRVDILNTLVTMLPGVSVTYYGEEIGMEDSCAKFEGNHEEPAVECDAETTKHQDTWVRSPMQWNKDKNAGFTKDDKPWIPVAKNYVNINVDVQKGIDKSHLEIHRHLLKMRKHNAITESDAHSMEIKALGENSFAFKRELPENQQSILVLINFNNVTEKVNLKQLSNMPDLMTVEIAGGNSAYKKGDQISIKEAFDLKEFESIVAFYNNSMSLLVSKIAFLLLIAVCAVGNWKF